jgi:hypothetical protein
MEALVTFVVLFLAAVVVIVVMARHVIVLNDALNAYSASTRLAHATLANHEAESKAEIARLEEVISQYKAAWEARDAPSSPAELRSRLADALSVASGHEGTRAVVTVVPPGGTPKPDK